MTPAELDRLHRVLESPEVVFTGDVITQILAAVDEVVSRIHWCDTCGCRMPLPVGHPHCGVCESALLLEQCKGCKTWFCKTGCRKDHVCGGGTEPQRFQS